MKKILVSVAAITLLTGALPQPASAFDFGAAFSSVSSNIQQKFRRVYLALPGEKPGKAVIEQSAYAMQGVETFVSDTTIDMVMKQGDQDLLSVDVAFSGPVVTQDFYDVSSYQQDLHFTGSLTAEGTTMTADADIKVDGDTTYFRLNQIPAVPFLQVGSLKDQWLKVPHQAAYTVNEDGTVAEATSEDTTMTADAELTPEQQQQIQALYREMIANAEVSPARRDTVDGVNVFVVDVTFTAEQIKTFVTRVSEIEGRSDEEIEVLSMEVEKMFGLFGDVTSTVMVDRSNFYPVQVSVPLEVDLAKVDADTTEQLSEQVVPFGDVSAADRVVIDVLIKMSDFNEPVEFSVPAEARDATEVFAETLGGALGLGAGSMKLPAGSTESIETIRNQNRPVELPTFSAEEAAMLKQYGIDPSDLR